MRLAVAFACVAVAASVAACNGGGQTDLTSREITDEELSRMVLPLSELGPGYTGFELHEDASGFRPNDDAGEGSFDPEDAAEDAERFGRIMGYRECYRSGVGATVGAGAYSVATAVILFENTDGASRHLRDAAEDGKRQVGATTSGGWTLEAYDEFDPGGIGDESIGALATLSGLSADEESVFYLTSVAFRHGRLSGVVTLTQLDQEDVRERAGLLARKLDERIAAVLRGEIEAARPGQGQNADSALQTERPGAEGSGRYLEVDEAPDALLTRDGE